VELVVLPVVVPPLVVPAVVVVPLDVDVPAPLVVLSVVVPELVAVVVEPVVVPPPLPVVEAGVVSTLPEGIAELLSLKGPNRFASPSRFKTKLPLVALANVRL
jgi:hypothetical protein